jgi:hypothetical protein
MTMPDNSFFELMRSVLGKIKTPFNKQQLVNDLETFLLREDIQKNIASYINSDDAKIIAAVALFGEPAPGELESFFSGELSFAQLQDLTVNLEERFILYRLQDMRLALNPVLEQILLPFAENTSILFHTEADEEHEAENSSARTVILNDRILAGLLSFVLQEELFFKAEGTLLRKRIVEAGKNCFPGMDLTQVFGSLQVLGLFYESEDKLFPDKNRFDELGLLSPRERSEYCAASLLVYNEIKSQTEILPPLYRTKIQETANFIHSFLDSLNADFRYSKKSLIRLAEIFKAKTGISVNSALLPEVLEQTGLFKQLVDNANDSSHVNESSRVIAIDSGFSILVYPEIEYADAISLASVLSIKEASFTENNGGVVRFELNKDSAVRAFNNNKSADEIISLLNRLSGGRVDHALSWNLKDWEKRYDEVSLKKGVILTLSEDRRYLTETAPLSSLIGETLAPGVYLLPENAMEDAAAALNSAGIDIIAKRRSEKAAVTSSQRYFPAPHAIYSVVLKAGTPDKSGTCYLIEDFHSALEKIPLDEATRSELSARIDRRLILCESQLKDAVVRYEKLEARHLDYAGKQNIAKQALSQQAPVEIEMGGKKIFGIPKALEKEDGKLVMVVVSEGEQEEIRIPLAKMSLLRRIKKSIFT